MRNTRFPLRWIELREQLEQEPSADATAIDAVETTLLRRRAGELHATGRVVVSSAGGVLLDEPWRGDAGKGDAAYCSAPPELGAYVREQARTARLLVAIAPDAQHATVRQMVGSDEHLVEVESSEVSGDARAGTHKPRGGALSHNQIQRRADEAAQHDAQVIANHVADVGSQFDPHLLVLAGEAQARTSIRAELPVDLAGICVEASRGGTDDAAAEEALADELRELAGGDVARREAARSEQFHAARAHGLAADGKNDVARAAEMGAVETLLFAHATPGTDESRLLLASASSGADVALVDADTALPESIGAVLRFPIEQP